MPTKNLISISLTVLFCGQLAVAQQPSRLLRFMFYNVENYFDTDDDPTHNDNEFLPSGSKHWTLSRYREKRDNIFRVAAETGGWETPAIIGLCEIENRKVLDDLVRNTPLNRFPYRIVHAESPDLRGIDVAIIYRSDIVRCLRSEFIRINFPDRRKRTRDIAYACLLYGKSDTVHVFVNHWPSRTGGQAKSEPARITVADRLRSKVDSLFARNPMAKILIAGDFNDGPFDHSLTQHLKALTDTQGNKRSELFNLSANKISNITGTLKYQGVWSVFDQIIVSGGLLQGPGLHTTTDSCQIIRAPFLFEDDKRYMGVKPRRTYIGMRYNGGYSDHLPVRVTLWSE